MSDKATKTDTVTLNMAQTLEIIRQPETKLVADGMKVSFDFEAKGDGLTYKWYSKNKAANTFSYTDSFDSNTYTTVMSDSRAGRQIYCVVTDMHGNSVQTDTVILRKKYYDKIIYPDNTAVIYAYDENNNIISVSDWAGRITRYTYDVNNNITGVVKPDGSVTTTVYNDAQQVVSTTEYNSSGIVIVGYEYTYDTLGRVTEEINLAENTKLCYTYDSLSRVTSRTTVNTTTNETVSQETFTYDAAGNIIGDNTETAFVYDTNNRLTSVNGQAVTYDLDGNMLSDGTTTFTYDWANRLTSAGGNTYSYDVEDIRVRNLCGESETTYTYNTNARLSQLLQKTTNGVATKYVYGVGLIGEESGGIFKTYHFDMRGSTTAITDMSGNVTDTFKYDTYGKLLSRTGTSDVIFLYNGRDGVVTDANGLLYMRARYYSPVLRRFVNADILHGEISDSTSLNRYAYVNGNPVSFVDPFGLSAERGERSSDQALINYNQAVLVSKFSNGGLPIVGHTVLYFLGDDGKWYSTEFNTLNNISGLKNKKSQAKIWFEVDVDVSAFYNSQTKTFIKNPKGFNYVVLHGNFNKSVELAKQYAGKDSNGNNKDFGRYNFLFHNCSDYTNKILDEAYIDGMYGQMSGDDNSLITIPVLRELELSMANKADSVNEYIYDGFQKTGEWLGETNIFGQFFIQMGNLTKATMDLYGAAADLENEAKGYVTDAIKWGYATVTNGIIDIFDSWF